MEALAEVGVDSQYGPFVRVSRFGATTTIYLYAETAVVTYEDGHQFGLEVSGPWYEFRSALLEMYSTSLPPGGVALGSPTHCE